MIRIVFLVALIGMNIFSWEQNLGSYIVFGLSLLLFLFLDLYVVRKVPFYRIFTALVILSLGSAFLFFISRTLNVSFNIERLTNSHIALPVFLNLLLVLFFFSLREGAITSYFKKQSDEKKLSEEHYIVDTSAIIDGRIISICEAGFLSPRFIIPEFVIKELQLISDSSNHEKRKKGRRGLDLLRKMKHSDTLSIKISKDDFEAKGVDNKLLLLAKAEGSTIVTTDFNLMKVAELEGIKVININQIATILKPLYTVGDKFKLTILKKGNNPNQGVGYLEDDTMVVIEEGEKFIGQTKQVVVTSYVQSVSGKMVFCKMVS